MGKSDIEYTGSGMEITWKNSQTDDSSSSSNESPRSEGSCCKCGVCLRTIIFAIFLLSILAVGLSVAFLGHANPVEFFVQQDPPGRNETNEWEITRGDGLSLVVENALEESWFPYLDEYVSKWDAGYGQVDPLTLTVRRVEYDYNCRASPGRLKVCNGDYGRTDWRGINIILLQNGFITQSVAKLNDYWLDREGITFMRYTMCHELGHGFGLAHTDESYYNINTGECMDYTSFPNGNLDPGAFNFDLLASIYGTPMAPLGSSSMNSGNRDLGEVMGGIVIPDVIMDKYTRAVQQVESMMCRDCLVDLGDGYELEIHQLSVE